MQNKHIFWLLAAIMLITSCGESDSQATTEMEKEKMRLDSIFYANQAAEAQRAAAEAEANTLNELTTAPNKVETIGETGTPQPNTIGKEDKPNTIQTAPNKEKSVVVTQSKDVPSPVILPPNTPAKKTPQTENTTQESKRIPFDPPIPFPSKRNSETNLQKWAKNLSEEWKKILNLERENLIDDEIKKALEVQKLTIKDISWSKIGGEKDKNVWTQLTKLNILYLEDCKYDRDIWQNILMLNNVRAIHFINTKYRSNDLYFASLQKINKKGLSQLTLLSFEEINIPSEGYRALQNFRLTHPKCFIMIDGKELVKMPNDIPTFPKDVKKPPVVVKNNDTKNGGIKVADNNGNKPPISPAPDPNNVWWNNSNYPQVWKDILKQSEPKSQNASQVSKIMLTQKQLIELVNVQKNSANQKLWNNFPKLQTITFIN